MQHFYFYVLFILTLLDGDNVCTNFTESLKNGLKT